MRLLLGLFKGILIGGAIGLGAYQLGLQGGWNWLTYGLVGILVGLLAGRPIWSHLADKNSTVMVAVVKAVFGCVIGIGVYALVAKAWGGMAITFQGQERNLYDWQPLFGAMVGALYGLWVEIDDAPAKGGAAPAATPAKPARAAQPAQPTKPTKRS